VSRSFSLDNFLFLNIYVLFICFADQQQLLKQQKERQLFGAAAWGMRHNAAALERLST
jgi:hypothetical protein